MKIYDRLLTLSVLTVSTLITAGCATENRAAIVAARDQQYRDEQYGPRLDELLTAPRSSASAAKQGSGQARARLSRFEDDTAGGRSNPGSERVNDPSRNQMRKGGTSPVFDNQRGDRKVGDQVTVEGEIVGTRQTRRGEVQEVVIFDGREEYQIQQPNIRNELAAQLGKRVRLNGSIGSLQGAKTVVQVAHYEVLE